MAADDLIRRPPTADIVILERPQDPDLAAFHQLWERKRGERAMPSRADLDPSEFPRLLPHIVLAETVPPPDWYRVRLAGEAVNEFYGRNMAGRTPRQNFAPAAAEGMIALYRSIVENRRPAFRTGRVYWELGKDYKRFENCLLPLSSDGDSVDMVIAAIKFLD